MFDDEEIKKPKKETVIYPMTVNGKPLRSDIVGQAGTFVDDFILAMNSEEVYKKMGVNPDKTFLITGKPGTGKTIGIDALVNEVNREFYKEIIDDKEAVPKLYGMQYDIGKYGSHYINLGSKIAQSFFDVCYQIAKNSKVLVVFDEAEVLFGNRRDGSSHKEDSKLLDTIMKNMQRIHDKDNMYAVMMSNFPDAFDEASIRAGRVDKRYELLLPNEAEREFAYEHTIGKINERAGYSVIRGFDQLKLAILSEEYSYADIVESVNSAVRKRAQEISITREEGKFPAGYITQKRLEDSVNFHRAAFHEKTKGIGFIQ